METFVAGADVTLTIPLQDVNGETVTPTAIEVVVLDEDENELARWSHPVEGVSGEIEVLVPAAYNSPGVRTVELTLTTAAGEVTQLAVYALRAPTRLVVLQNSFQTWGRALAEAGDMPNLLGWEGAEDFERQTALIEAFRRLIRLGYLVRWPREIDDMRYLTEIDRRIAPQHWATMTHEQWSTWYPETFRAALRRAQIAEADQIIGGDRIGEKRRAGIFAETIGESKMMFRMGKPLDLGVSAQALQHVTGFVDLKMTTGRA